MREARALAALNHPSVCTPYDVGPDCLVMEYIEVDSPKGPLPGGGGARLRQADRSSSRNSPAHFPPRFATTRATPSVEA